MELYYGFSVAPVGYRRYLVYFKSLDFAENWFGLRSRPLRSSGTEENR